MSSGSADKASNRFLSPFITLTNAAFLFKSVPVTYDGKAYSSQLLLLNLLSSYPISKAKSRAIGLIPEPGVEPAENPTNNLLG